MTTFHIRRRRPRKGGRPFYTDHSLRYAPPYCGAKPTSFDIADHDRATAWKRQSDGEQFRPCADCIEKRIEGGVMGTEEQKKVAEENIRRRPC